MTHTEEDLFAEYVHPMTVSGMPLTIAFRVNTQPNPPMVLPGLQPFADRLDAMFDNDDENSPLMALRLGRLDEVDIPPMMVTILQQASEMREATGGLFDPWRSPDGFRFNGWFRGWVAQQLKNRCATAGYWDLHIHFENVNLYSGQQGHSIAWPMNVPDPADLTDTFEYRPASPGTLVTVGKGSPIVNPGTLEPVDQERAVSVYGPDGAHADAFAAAIMVGGKEYAEWLLSRIEGYGVLLVESDAVYGYGEIADKYVPVG